MTAIDSTLVASGSDLTFNVSQAAADTGTLRHYRYWVGLVPDCPLDVIDVAGISFPKRNEKLYPDPMQTGEMKRAPVIGGLAMLTEEHLLKLRSRVARMVIRHLSDGGQKDEPGTGQNVGDFARRPRRAEKIVVPTEDQIAEARRQGRPITLYQPDHQRDVPAAKYMFCVRMDEDARSADKCPPVLETTGLTWPTDLASKSVRKSRKAKEPSANLFSPTEASTDIPDTIQ